MVEQQTFRRWRQAASEHIRVLPIAAMDAQCCKDVRGKRGYEAVRSHLGTCVCGRSSAVRSKSTLSGHLAIVPSSSRLQLTARLPNSSFDKISHDSCTFPFFEICILSDAQTTRHCRRNTQATLFSSPDTQPSLLQVHYPPHRWFHRSCPSYRAHRDSPGLLHEGLPKPIQVMEPAPLLV